MKNKSNFIYKIFLNKIRNISGFSQVEIMVTILVISIVILGVITTFGTIGKGLITSKTRTIANNLAQEKVESLKNYSYARLLITSYSDLATYGYDNTNTEYQPETLRVGDATFRRYTTVWRAREEVVGGDTMISTMTPTASDEGIKKIKVEIKWNEGNEEKTLSLYNLRDDPNRATLGGVVYGFITTTGTAVGISGASVEILQNLSWTSQTSSTGYYLIKTTSPAKIQVSASKNGYWANTTANLDVSVNQNIQLTQKLTGTVTGWVVFNDHLQISLIAASTDYSGNEQEYIQLYNPTTWAWTMSDKTIHYIDKDDNDPGAFGGDSGTAILVCHNDTISSYGYYLIANTGTIYINGVSVNADATYDQCIGGPYQNGIKNSVPGGIILSYTAATFAESLTRKIDSVAWGKTAGLGADPPSKAIETEGYKYVDAGYSPIIPGKQLLRFHYTGQTYGYVNNVRGGGAYDSNKNSDDFYYGVIPNLCPYNSSVSTHPASGTPAYGAVISANDGLASPTTAYYKDNNRPNGYFSLNVATGTWTIYITSGSYFREISNVSVNYGVGTAIPNNSTSPIYPVYASTKLNVVILSSPSTGGFVSGKVVQAGTSTGIPGIEVTASGLSPVTTDASGNFNFSLSVGSYTIKANANCDDIDWTEDFKNVEVTEGKSVTTDNLELYPAGTIAGITKNSSGDAMPYITVVSTSTNASFCIDTVSGADGTYLLKGVKVADDIVVFPILDALDDYDYDGPWLNPITISQGNELINKNFTITSTWGKISGSVSEEGNTITTGVLLMATSGSAPAESPPMIDSSLRTSNNIYGAISDSDGAYEIQVRKGFDYYIRAWYTKTSGDTVVTETKTGSSAISVSVSSPSATVNFTGTWP